MELFGKAAFRIKNFTQRYSDTQGKVRDATSTDPWGPTSVEMHEIAQRTYTKDDFIEIMELLDKRLNEQPKNWRNVYKSLVVLEYCLHVGSENVIRYFQDNIYIIKTLKEFQYIDGDGKDQGANVRRRAKDITNLLQDESRLQEERRKRRRRHDQPIPVGSISNNWQNRAEEDLGKAVEDSDERWLGTKQVSAAERDLQMAIKLSEEEEARRNNRAGASLAVLDHNKSSPSTSGDTFPSSSSVVYAAQVEPQYQPHFASYQPPWRKAKQLDRIQDEYMRRQYAFVQQNEVSPPTSFSNSQTTHNPFLLPTPASSQSQSYVTTLNPFQVGYGTRAMQEEFVPQQTPKFMQEQQQLAVSQSSREKEAWPQIERTLSSATIKYSAFEKPVDLPDTQIVELAARLGALFADRTRYRQYLACRDSNAQGLLDLFQRLLDVLKFPPSSGFRRDLTVAIQRLAGASGLYPVCYELTDVTTGGYPKSSGSFADIYQGTFRGRAVCLKTIRLDMTTDTQHFLKVCSKEAILWGQLSHPNLLPFYGVFRFGGRISMVSPWMVNGDINNYLKNHPSADRALLALDVSQGLLFLHKNGVIHGDLKGPNILVNESGRACVADFGISSISDPQILAWTSHSAVASKGGSVRWQAPELFDPEGDEDMHNTIASDVYAWSCVAYEIFAGHVPFVHVPRDTAVIFKVTKGERPARPSADLGLTNHIWSLMQDCWEANPTERPTVDQIIERLMSNLPRDTRPVDEQNGDVDLSPAQFREMAREGLTHEEMTVGTLERLLNAR